MNKLSWGSENVLSQGIFGKIIEENSLALFGKFVGRPNKFEKKSIDNALKATSSLKNCPIKFSS